MRQKLVLLLAVLLCSSAEAATPRRIVAVIPFDFKRAALDLAAHSALEESVRIIAGDVLSRAGYTVLTGETQLKILAENNIDPTKACEASCALEAARELKASLFISGTVMTTEGSHLVFIKLYSTDDGGQLSSLELQGKTLGELKQQLKERASTFFLQATEQQSLEGEALGKLVITSNVKDAEVSIDGKPQVSRAGNGTATFELRAGSHQIKVSKSGYFEHLQKIDVLRGQAVTIAAQLSPEQAPVQTGYAGMRSTFLTITTEPPKAVLTLNGRVIGRSNDTFTIAPGSYELTAALDLYHPSSARIEVAEGEVKTVQLQLKPNFGGLRVASQPAGASVYLDGQFIGTTDRPLSAPRVTTGVHMLRLSLSRHHDYVQRVEIKDGETLSVDAPPLRSSVGSLRIQSMPAGAEVEVDGQFMGRAPCDVPDLAGGPHEVKLSLPRHEPLQRTVEVAEGQRRVETFMLEPLFAPLSFTSNVASSHVFVDGKPVGLTPLEGLLVDEGEHVIRIAAPSDAYAPFERRYAVVRGRSLTVDAVLTPITGRLVVITEPPGAHVQIDSNAIGNAPQVLDAVLAGKHTVSVTLEGHRPGLRDITVRQDQETIVQIRLIELAAEERAAQLVAQWQKETRPRRIFTYAASAAGVLLLAGAVYGYDQMNQAVLKRDATYAQYLVNDGSSAQVAAQYGEYVSEVGRVNQWRRGTIGLVAAGLLAAGGAAYVWMNLPPKPSLEIAVTATPSTGGGLALAASGKW